MSNVPAEPSRLSAPEIEALTLEELDELLKSEAHYARTETRNYGERDPLDDPGSLVWRCKRECTAELTLDTPSVRQVRMARGGAVRKDTLVQSVKCSACGLEGPPSLREWRAVVDWNYLRARVGEGSLEHFPFFNLRGLTPEQRVRRLESVQYDLTLRRALERKRKAAGLEVGGRFLAKIDAYLGWANIALALARHPSASKGSSQEPLPNAGTEGISASGRLVPVSGKLSGKRTDDDPDAAGHAAASRNLFSYASRRPQPGRRYLRRSA